ncbi:MAG: Imm74 family immunity protein [Rhizomicrobium sp.]
MGFTWLNKQGVESEDGFALQSISRFAFEYREGSKTMRLGGESLFANLGTALFGFGFYPGWRNAKWEPPHENEAISEEHRKRIVKNIEAAMAFMKGKAKFE